MTMVEQASTRSRPNTVKSIKENIAMCHTALDQLELQLAIKRGKRFFSCASGACKRKTQIRNLDLIQTMWYTSPSGCMGGDHWNNGELVFVCPHCGVRNRLLNFKDDKNGIGSNAKQKQFKRIYGDCFKTVSDITDVEVNKMAPGFINNMVLETFQIW